MRGVLAALVALGATSGCGGGGTEPAPWLEGYKYRKPVELHPLPLVKGLADFPVAITANADPDLMAHAAVGGSDIVVTDAAGLKLSFELEELDSDGRLALWVQIPELGGMVVYLYYGGETAANAPEETWTERFATVWHLAGENPAIATDSSRNLLHLSQASVDTQPNPGRGIVGGARVFDGMDDFLVFNDPGTTALDPGAGSFSYCLWAFPTGTTGVADGALYKGGGQGNAGYDLEMGDGGWTINVSDTGTGQVSIDAAGFDPVLLSRWFHACAVIDRTTQQLHAYGNGAPRSRADISALGSVEQALALQLGMIDAGNPFLGKIDEVRVYTEALPLAWVVAEYVNLTEPETFFTIGPEESRP